MLWVRAEVKLKVGVGAWPHGSCWSQTLDGPSFIGRGSAVGDGQGLVNSPKCGSFRAPVNVPKPQTPVGVFRGFGGCPLVPALRLRLHQLAHGDVCH